MKSDFKNMSRRELRAYIIAHPDDKVAFHAFVDRSTAEASSEMFELPQSKADVAKIDSLIQQKVQQLK